MAELNIDDLQEYNFKNAQKGDVVVVATISYSELQSFETCLVKSVSPKKRDVTLDNGLKYSKDGYEYGRVSFCRIHHRVFVDNEETREIANSYMAHREIAWKIMGQIREISVKLMMESTADNCRKLSLVLDEILDGGD